MNNNQDIFFTRKELQDYLKVSRSFLNKLIKAGKVKGRLLGKRKMLFNKAEIIEQLASLPSQTTTSPANQNNLNG